MSTNRRLFADVFVDDYDDRRRLQRSALFYIPAALLKCEPLKITVASLVSASVVERDRGSKEVYAGKLAIQTIFACKQPVNHESITNFLKLVNFVFKGRDKLGFEDVVACVFRLTQPEVAEKLGLSASAIAQISGVPEVIVESALEGYRVAFADAAAIVAAFQSVRSKKPFVPISKALPAKLDTLVAADTREDGGFHLAVKSLGKTSTARRPLYVYSRGLLHPAPTLAHPWAIS